MAAEERKGQAKAEGRLVVISGFSGSGKGTVIGELLKRSQDHVLSVSMTTRQPREGEKEGVSYFFVTRDRFEEEIRRDSLLEYASYVEHYYGTPRFYVEEHLGAGRNVLLEIEVQGALQVRGKRSDALMIFIVTPSAKELERRLEGRNSEEPAVVTKRLRQALEEAKSILFYDHMVINDDLQETVRAVESLIRGEAGIGSYPPDPAFVETFVRDLKEIIAQREKKYF